MSSAINCHYSLICCLGNVKKNKVHLSLCPYLFSAPGLAGFSHGGKGHSIVCQKVLVLVLVWLSPSNLSFMPAQGTSESILKAL